MTEGNVVSSVLDRKRARANLSYSIIKSIFFAILALIAVLFQSSFDTIWDHLGGVIISIFVIFFVTELYSILRFFVARPISLTEKQSKLLNAKGVDFIRQIPKPSFTPKRDTNESSLSSCLLNRSHDSAPGKSPNKKSPNLAPNLNSSIRNRRSLSSPANQSINEDETELDQYLGSLSSPDNNESILFQEQPKKSYTSPIRSMETLSRFQYQVSKSPPQNLSADQNQDLGKVTKGANAWTQLGIDSATLNSWTTNMRRYLWATIVHPLIKEIKNVNRQLKVSLPDVQLGKTSISDLRMISHPVLSTDIRRLVPYLEISRNHGYLISRLDTLEDGGYLSKYIWNGGEEFGGKAWSSEHPTDSAILVHILTCWLDTHLPPDPAAGPDARACSERFIRKSEAEKKSKKNKMEGNKIVHNLPQKVPVALIEHSTSPPEYYVQIGDKVKEIPSGRNNPLHAILLMFYLLNKENHGEMAGVSLGKAGINILSVFK